MWVGGGGGGGSKGDGGGGEGGRARGAKGHLTGGETSSPQPPKNDKPSVAAAALNILSHSLVQTHRHSALPTPPVTTAWTANLLKQTAMEELNLTVSECCCKVFLCVMTHIPPPQELSQHPVISGATEVDEETRWNERQTAPSCMQTSGEGFGGGCCLLCRVCGRQVLRWPRQVERGRSVSGRGWGWGARAPGWGLLLGRCDL